MLAVLDGHAATTLKVVPLNGVAPGTTSQLPIHISGTDDIVALQFDLFFATAGVALLARRGEQGDMVLESSNCENGAHSSHWIASSISSMRAWSSTWDPSTASSVPLAPSASLRAVRNGAAPNGVVP